MRFLISYDLTSPGQNYRSLIDALEELGAVRVLLSAWYLVSDNGAEQIRDYLRQFIDPNDRLLVVRFDIWAWVNLLNRID